MPLSSTEVYVRRVGGSVRVRAIPPKLLEVFARRARRPNGRVDFHDLQAQKLVHGLVDPSFTVEEAHQLLDQYGPAST